MISLAFLIAIQIVYMRNIEKNNLTILALTLIDAAIISTWLTNNFSLAAGGAGLLLATLLVKLLEIVEKGITNHEKNFNPTADRNMREPFNPDAS